MRTIVVGAGLAGLAAADALTRAGVEVRVFEARDRVGGRVWSVPFAGAVVERGAEFILPGNDTVKALAEHLHLPLVRKGTTYGNREPRGVSSLSTVDIRTALGHVATLEPRDGETVDALLTRSAITPAAAELISARISVSCAYPSSDLAASVVVEDGTAFGDFDTHTVEGGNQRIASALAATIGEHRLALSTPVTRLRWSGDEVTVNAGGAETTADHAVIAVPASVISTIVFDPPLPSAKADALAGVRYGDAAKLFIPLRAPAPPSATMAVGERFWCFTGLGADGKPVPVLGAFAGTSDALDALALTDGPGRWAGLLAALRPDLDLDLDRAFLSTWADDPWARGVYSARAAASPMDDAELARPVGALAFAGEHTAGAEHGMMEGALLSGLRAAADLLSSGAAT